MGKDNFIETDLSEFEGNLKEVAELLTKYEQGEIADNSKTLGDGLKICHNYNSGYTFLSDNDYRVLMLNDKGKLEEWLNCGECGEEGLKSDFEENQPKTYFYQLHVICNIDEDGHLKEDVFFYSEDREITVDGILNLAVKEHAIDKEARLKLVIDVVKEITKDEYNELSYDFFEEEDGLFCTNCHKRMQ